jgi:hypothetical protein
MSSSTTASPSPLSSVEAALWDAAENDRIAHLAELGGWEAVASCASTLAGSPLLPELARSLLAGWEQLPNPSAAVGLLVDGLERTLRPAAFAETAELLLDAPTVLHVCAQMVHDTCLRRVHRRTLSDAELAGAALEAALRLALGGWVAEFDILSVLVRLDRPQPFPFARHAVRCLGAAFEHWRDERLVAALRAIADADDTTDGQDSSSWDVERLQPDAAFELGHVALLHALTAADWLQVREYLEDAWRLFDVARSDEDRIDARILGTTVAVLAEQLDAPVDERSLTELADQLARDVTEHVIGYAGLEHWRGARLDVEVAWARLVRDVTETQDALRQPSWYEAGRTLERILAVYTASRCVQVLTPDDVQGVRAILAPRIEAGIGVRAALLRHLEDHIVALSKRVEQSDAIAPVDAAHELATARQLLSASKAALDLASRQAKSPKSESGNRSQIGEQLPRLATLLDGDFDEVAALWPTRREALLNIEEALEERATPLPAGESLVVSEAFSRCQRALADCLDYRDDVRCAVDEVLLTLLRFVRSRAQRSPSRRGAAYLFKPDAQESDLAEDLAEFLDSSDLGSRVHSEVRDIGGGRVDVAIFYEGFTLVCELKREHSDISVDGLHRYLLQAAAYQGSEVTVGYLLVLDLRARTGPAPDLRSGVWVQMLDDLQLGRPRHVVTLIVPGNRRVPSSMR